MKWMKERDLLIAQTMAFVQSVTGKKPDAGMLAGVAEAAKSTTSTTIELAAALTETTLISAPPRSEPSKSRLINSELRSSELIESEPIKSAPPGAQPGPIHVLRVEPPGDVQSEIKERIANFRAHQERFLRERDEYCSATMAKVRAVLRDDAGSPQSTK